MKRSRSIFKLVIPFFIFFATYTYTGFSMVAINDTVTTTSNDGAGSLRQVIASAASGDTIVFDASLNGDSIMLSASITIDKNLTIVGNGTDQTIIDGSLYDDDRLVSIEIGHSVIFKGITFQHGGGANFNSNGGAISLIESDGAFISCFFHHNQTAGFGDAGALDAEGPAELDIVHCIFSNNIAGDDGGAIRTRFGIVLDIAQSTFVKNEAPDLGGGIYVVSANDDLTIHNSIIAGNTSLTGPDVFVIDPFTNRDYQYNLISDTNNIGNFPGLSVGYPTFVDEANYNFQLADESVGIDAGDQNLIPVDQYDIDSDGDVAEVIDIDLNGGLRLVDCNVDLGPYENQEILTTRFIHNTNDMGPGSIRHVISCAQTGDTIKFSSSIDGDSIQLKTGQITLDNISLTFIGNGSDLSIIDGSKQSTRFFLVQANAHIKFRDMTMQHAGDSTADIGGAVVLYGLDSRIDLVNCRLANNLSGNRGGFIYVFLGHLNAVNCVFDGNAVPGIDQDGGVIGIQNNSSLSVSQCLFKNNYASDAGSCIFSISSDMTISNCTFASNKTSDEAVIFFQGVSSVTASNNIVYGNNGDQAFQQITGGTFDANNNLVDVPGSLVVGSNGNFISDPLFVDSLNGNYQLQNTSPAIDVGDVSLLPLDSCDVDGDGDLSEIIDVDLLGNQRVAICDLDLGAYVFTLQCASVEVKNTICGMSLWHQ